jgi:hypothetical protein
MTFAQAMLPKVDQIVTYTVRRLLAAGRIASEGFAT